MIAGLPPAPSTDRPRAPGAGRSVGAGAIAVLACFGLGGCAAAGTGSSASQRSGAAPPDSAALRRVRAAAQATLASSAGVTIELVRPTIFGRSRATVSGTGNFIFPAGIGRVTIDLGEVKRQEPGNEAVAFRPTMVYLQPKSGTTAAVLPRGKTWLSATLSGAGSVATNFPSFAAQVEGVGPQILLKELAGGATRARPLGPIHGGRGFDVSIDLARAIASLSGPDAALLGQALRTQLAAGGAAASISVVLDAHGRVGEIRAAPKGVGVGALTMTMCCFGETLHVVDPPPSAVLDIAALTPSGERENNGGGDADGG